MLLVGAGGFADVAAALRSALPGSGKALIVRNENPLIERCEITSDGGGGAVEISIGADPTLRHCTIKSRYQGLILQNAGGRYERCLT